MKYLKILIIVLVIAVAGIIFYKLDSKTPAQAPAAPNAQGTSAVATSTGSGIASKASMIPYSNTKYGIAFQYPSDLYIKEREVGTAAKPQLSITLVRDTQENRDLINGKSKTATEGPVSITIDVYMNPENLVAREWVSKATNWSMATKEAVPIKVGDRNGMTFSWSGLYEGKTIVLTEGMRAYVLAVTWMDPQEQIIRDMAMILHNIELVNK